MRAVADGERHHRRVRLAGSAGAATAVLAVLIAGWTVTGMGGHSSPPATQTTGAQTPSPTPQEIRQLRCSVQQLRTPDGQGPKAVVSGADPTGRYIVGRSYPGGKPVTVMWIDRAPHQVPMSGDDPMLHDVTSTGVAVGSSLVGDESAAWVYTGGKFSRLPGREAQAFGINERLNIVGSVNDKPALWRAPGDQPSMLALPGPQWTGTAMGIDEDGTIVGAVSPKQGGTRAGALWRPDGTFESLSVPSVHGSPAGEFLAKSIRNGWVLGWAAFDADRVRYLGAPLWNVRSGARRDGDGFAETVNAQGWVLQSAVLLAGDAGEERVALPVPAGFEPQPDVHAYTVSDDGSTLAGQVATVNGDVGHQPVPIVWTCHR